MNDRHCPVKATPRRRRQWMSCLPKLAMLPRRRQLLRQPNSAASPIILLPDELIVEIISWLPVKTLMKVRCVNKFLKTTISDPHFVQMHLKKSSRNSQVAQFRQPDLFNLDRDASFVTLSIPDLLRKKITILHDSPLHELNHYLKKGQVVGSCNGLICFIFYSYDFHKHCHWLCFWNPAMRTVSEFSANIYGWEWRRVKYSFGYDNSAGTYKVVAFYVEEKHGHNPKGVVKVFTLGDNSWRDIQCFPVLPLNWWSHKEVAFNVLTFGYSNNNNGVYLSGTINWLALRNYYFQSDYYAFHCFKGVAVEQFVIVSLDLSFQPTVAVLTDCLCFGHQFETTHFVLWQMKDFGVQESWVQLFKISYQILYSSGYRYFFDNQILPLYLSKKGHTLIFTTHGRGPAFVYNCIDNKIGQIRTTDKIWRLWVKNYIESLVPTC